MTEKSHKISTPSGDITLTTGKVAKLSGGAVMVQKGGTVLLATADTKRSAGDMDFFPLTIEYLKRYAAVGTLSGSRFNKREGFPSESAIITARQVDHTIRPLFPKHFRNPTNVILTLLSDDGVNKPEELTVLGASAALMISAAPFAGPAASVLVSIDLDGNVEINPSEHHAEEDLLGHFEVSATSDKILSIEGWGKEVSDEKMDEVLDKSLETIKKLCAEQLEFAKGISQEKIVVEEKGFDAAVEKIFMETEKSNLESVMYIADKPERDAAIGAFKESLVEKYVEEDGEISSSLIGEALDYYMQKIMRENVMKSEKRMSGRKLDEVRELTAEVDVLPDNVHGSALFSRGYTQSLSTVTLGSTRKSVGFDDMSGEDTNVPFMHHYNFPPFSVGEAGRVSYRPGRREIGHGKIGENALRHMIPSQEDFPYTVRAVSEIMTSNGSTSMAATCASSLALMAAGVPMKAAVGGIGVGLVTADESQSEYKLILDIEGIEDFFGDMDFKVTGTRKGLTAIQFETKLKGVNPEILKESFRLAFKGRQQVLDVMDKAIAKSRDELSAKAPRVETIVIPVDMIGEIIGPGGKVIKAIIADAKEMTGSEPDVDIQEDGRMNITADSKEQIELIKSQVRVIIDGPQQGSIYKGEVVNVTDFGAFVAIGHGVEGLVHISEIAKERVEKVSDYLKPGDQVKVIALESNRGKNSFSIKQVPADQK